MGYYNDRALSFLEAGERLPASLQPEPTPPVPGTGRFLSFDDIFFTQASQPQARTLYPSWGGWPFSQPSDPTWCLCTCGCAILVGTIVRDHKGVRTGQIFCERCGDLYGYY